MFVPAPIQKHSYLRIISLQDKSGFKSGLRVIAMTCKRRLKKKKNKMIREKGPDRHPGWAPVELGYAHPESHVGAADTAWRAEYRPRISKDLVQNSALLKTG